MANFFKTEDGKQALQARIAELQQKVQNGETITTFSVIKEMTNYENSKEFADNEYSVISHLFMTTLPAVDHPTDDDISEIVDSLFDCFIEKLCETSNGAFSAEDFTDKHTIFDYEFGLIEFQFRMDKSELNSYEPCVVDIPDALKDKTNALYQRELTIWNKANSKSSFKAAIDANRARFKERVEEMLKTPCNGSGTTLKLIQQSECRTTRPTRYVYITNWNTDDYRKDISAITTSFHCFAETICKGTKNKVKAVTDSLSVEVSLVKVVTDSLSVEVSLVKFGFNFNGILEDNYAVALT